MKEAAQVSDQSQPTSVHTCRREVYLDEIWDQQREIATWMGQQQKLYRVSAGIICPLHTEGQRSSLLAQL